MPLLKDTTEQDVTPTITGRVTGFPGTSASSSITTSTLLADEMDFVVSENSSNNENSLENRSKLSHKVDSVENNPNNNIETSRHTPVSSTSSSMSTTNKIKDLQSQQSSNSSKQVASSLSNDDRSELKGLWKMQAQLFQQKPVQKPKPATTASASSTSISSTVPVTTLASSDSSSAVTSSLPNSSISSNSITTSTRPSSSMSSPSPMPQSVKLCRKRPITSMTTATRMINHHLKQRRTDLPRLVDSHCHLSSIKKRKKNVKCLDDILKIDSSYDPSKFRGVISNFVHPSDWSQGPNHDQVSQLLLESSEDNRIGITIGCHPHFAEQMTEDKWKQYSKLVKGSWLKIVAVGECGLDYSTKNRVPKEIQKKVFTKQLKLAMEHNLPLVLHIRDAEEDGLEVLDQAGVPANYPIHRHCFGGNLEAAFKWILKFPGSKIGVTGLITKRDEGALRMIQIVKEIEMCYILLGKGSLKMKKRKCEFSHLYSPQM